MRPQADSLPVSSVGWGTIRSARRSTAIQHLDRRTPTLYDVELVKAFLETLGDLANPKPEKQSGPKWGTSDYIALGVLSLILALIYGFWPLSPILPQ
jgi:hypothetical protein